MSDLGDPAECPLCRTRSTAAWTVRGRREVHRCRTCACIWVPAGLARDERGTSVYEGEEPIFVRDGNDRYYLDETNLVSCRPKVAWVREGVAPGSRLLDVGASFGHFVSEARAIFDATGLEVSDFAVQKSRELFGGIRCVVGSIEDPPAAVGGPWDVVTLWDVIEHVPDPRATLERIRELLAPGGRLYVSTPDADSLVARVLRSRWHYVDPIQHLVLFGRRNLTALLERAGFRVDERRRLGHAYRVGYVVDRLAYLHRESGLGAALRPLQRAARPFAGATVRINLGDVMGLSARRRA